MLTKLRFSDNQPSSQGSFLLLLSPSLSLSLSRTTGANRGEPWERDCPSTKIDSLIGLNRPGSKVELHMGRL